MDCQSIYKLFIQLLVTIFILILILLLLLLEEIVAHLFLAVLDQAFEHGFDSGLLLRVNLSSTNKLFLASGILSFDFNSELVSHESAGFLIHLGRLIIVFKDISIKHLINSFSKII